MRIGFRQRASVRARKVLVGVLTAALGTSALVAVAPSAEAAISINTSAYYVLVNAHSQKAMDLYGWSTDDGGEFRQWARADGWNQQFQFVSSGDGYYRLKNRHSGKVVDIWGWSKDDGAEVRQYGDINGANQQFKLSGSSNSAVQLINKNSGKALEVWEWSTSDGGRVSQYSVTGAANQTWSLVAVGSGSTPTTTTSSGGGSGCGSGSPEAEVTTSGSTYTAKRSGNTVYSGSDFTAAAQAAIDSLTSGRNYNQRVVIRNDASISAASRISLRSYTTFESCGTINVTGSGTGDMAPVYARGVNNIDIPYLKVTGTPNYGVFMRSVNNLHLGQIDLRLSHGLGVRIDNFGDKSVFSKNISIDNVYVQVPDQGVETYGVDGITIGKVTARNVGYSGLLLNQTINATIGTVDASNTGTGTGYAAFRMANRNGRIGSSYPTNIRVGNVIASGGGRGVFCVSESGGAVIDKVTISNTGNNAVLIENCYNVTLAGSSGSISGGGEIRVAARSDFPANWGITLQNLKVTNNTIRVSPCGGVTVKNNQLVNSSQSVC